jgi:hypothetical protein
MLHHPIDMFVYLLQRFFFFFGLALLNVNLRMVRRKPELNFEEVKKEGFLAPHTLPVRMHNYIFPFFRKKRNEKGKLLAFKK